MSAQRNTFGGKAYKKAKSGNVRRRSKNPDMPVDVSTGYDHYAIVLKKLGNNRLLVKLDNGLEVQAIIPGRFMKKVWFNSGDYIHVKREGEDGKFYYDIFQKITNETELHNAKSAVQQKLDDGEQDIFRPDTNFEEDEEDDIIQSGSNSENEESLDKIYGVNKNLGDREKRTVAPKITPDKIKKQNVSAEKLHRKQQHKDRDISRRAEPEFFEKPISVVHKEDKEKDVSGSDSADVDIDDI
jgi:translation initiation factor IF-1